MTQTDGLLFNPNTYYPQQFDGETQELIPGEFIAVARPNGPKLGFQKVDDPTPGKNRLHLDLIPPGDGPQQELDRLVGLGATVLDDQPPGAGWLVLADPEGNEFCLEGAGTD